IHFSSATQVRETAARYFAGAKDLMLIAVDADALGDALKWEPSRGGDLFPHLYGELPLAAVLWARPLPLGIDQRHVFPELTPRSACSSRLRGQCCACWTQRTPVGLPSRR